MVLASQISNTEPIHPDDIPLDDESEAILDRLVKRTHWTEKVWLPLHWQHQWEFYARQDQLPPDGDWDIWLLLGGRGSGKTRAGAEYVNHRVWNEGARNIALVAPTHNDGREVMLDGPSGLLNIGPKSQRPKYIPSRRRLEWPNGAVGHVYSSEEPGRLRGPQHDTVWLDEFCAMQRKKRTLDNIRFGLRLPTATGADPKMAITTTPKPGKALRELIKCPGLVTTRAKTLDNKDNLSPAYLSTIHSLYGGTRLGRQELNGEYIEDPPGALFTRELIEDCVNPRVPELNDFERVIVAIDPPAKASPTSNACGIIVAGRMGFGDGAVVWILKDASVQGLTPQGWARQAVRNWKGHEANYLLAETNQGGDMVGQMIRQINKDVVVKSVHASRGKTARAEPVAMLYEQGRIRHADHFEGLADELCQMGADESSGSRSPDRADALVWAVTDLLLNVSEGPRIRVIGID